MITGTSFTTTVTSPTRASNEPGKVSLVAAPAMVGEVPQPLQAGLGAGRSGLRLPSVTERYWGTDPRTG